MNAAGELMLAAAVTGTATNLSIESTATALARLLLPPATSPTQASQLESSIRSSSAFAPLKAELLAALQAGTPPAASKAVLERLADLIQAVSSPAPARASALIANPPLEFDRFPVTLVKPNDRPKWRSIYLRDGNVSCATVVNEMPITWQVVSRRNNTEIDRKLLPRTSSECVAGSTQGFDLIVSQTDETWERDDAARWVRMWDHVRQYVDLTLTCSGTLSEELVTAFWRSQAARAKTYLSSLDEMGHADTWRSLFDYAQCTATDRAIEALPRFAREVAQQARSFIEASIIFRDVADDYVAFKYAEYYDGKSLPIGLCATLEGQIVNCATEYKLTPTPLRMAPLATHPLAITAFRNDGKVTGVPSGLIYQSGNEIVAKVDPLTGLVSAVGVVGSPTEISVEDKWTGIRGSANVIVMFPKIEPLTKTIAPSGELILKLTDGAGAPVAVPPGLEWEAKSVADDTTRLELVEAGERFGYAFSRWRVPSDAPSGYVTVKAYLDKSLPYDSGLYFVDFPTDTFQYTGKELKSNGTNYDGPIPVPGPVNLVVTLKSVIPADFTGSIDSSGIARVRFESSGVGTFDRIPPFPTEWAVIRFTGGFVTAWSFSTLLFATEEACTCRTFNTTSQGKIHNLIGSGKDVRFAALDEGALRRCVSATCTYHERGGLGQEPGKWERIPIAPR